ncbi:MAG: hypothetical protein WA135_05745 [Thiobacillus sp.]
MRCINEQLTKANDCLRFATDDLRGALADANAVQALVLLPLIADTTRLAQQVSALIVAMGACESEAQHKFDWELIGKVMAKHGIPGDIAPLESESGFIARLLDEACSRSSWTQHASNEVDGMISIEMKRHVLHLDDLEEAVSLYADDVDPGQGGVLQGKLRGFSGCTHVSLIRNDWVTVAASLRYADNHSAAAYIEEIIDTGAGNLVAEPGL